MYSFVRIPGWQCARFKPEKQDECHFYAITFLERTCYKQPMQRSLLRFAPLFFVVLTALSLLCVSPHPAQAQTPEPTPTATPAWQYSIVLSSGAEMIVDRRVSYGEIGVVVTLIGVALLLLFYIMLMSIKMWSRKS